MSNEKPPDLKGNFERPMITCPKCGELAKRALRDRNEKRTVEPVKGKDRYPVNPVFPCYQVVTW